MLIAGMIDDQIHNQLHSPLMQACNKPVEIFHSALERINRSVITDIIAVIDIGRIIMRGQPDDLHPKGFQVIQPVYQTGEIAYAITVTVAERPCVHLIDNSFFPPFFLMRRIGFTHFQSRHGTVGRIFGKMLRHRGRLLADRPVQRPASGNCSDLERERNR